MFAELLLTGQLTTCAEAAGIAAKASITIPVLTMLEARDGEGAIVDATPALLDGVTPIPMSVAREIAAAAPAFERILTHPITGTVVEVDRYRPTEAMRAWLRARDVHCRFPGCRLPAEYCDLDHTIPASEGGPTSLGNLADLCRWNHTVKGNTRWHVRQLAGGVLEWTSPTGIVLPDIPEPRGVTFTPSPPGGSSTSSTPGASGLRIGGRTYRAQPLGAGDVPRGSLRGGSGHQEVRDSWPRSGNASALDPGPDPPPV